MSLLPVAKSSSIREKHCAVWSPVGKHSWHCRWAWLPDADSGENKICKEELPNDTSLVQFLLAKPEDASFWHGLESCSLETT